MLGWNLSGLENRLKYEVEAREKAKPANNYHTLFTAQMNCLGDWETHEL